MADERRPDHDTPTEHPDVRYERGDLRLGWVIGLVLGGCFVLAIIAYSVWRFYWWQEAVQQSSDVSSYPYPAAPWMQLPPQPRLEQLDRMAGRKYAAVEEQLAAKEQVLNRYGPTSAKGFVHIPIRQAIGVLAAEARAGELKQRVETSGGKDRGLLDAGESNSGRVFRGKLP